MAATIENVSLSITSETGLQDALQAVITRAFTLTDYDDGTDDPIMTSGRSGEIGAALYRVEGGDFTVDMSSVSADGVYYIYVEDTGSGVTAEALSTVPTWADNGYYNGNAKAFFRFNKVSTSYNDRSDIIHAQGYVPSNISVINISASGTITGDVTGDLTGDVTGNLTGDVTGDLNGADITLTGDIDASTGTIDTFDSSEITASDLIINSSTDGITGTMTGFSLAPYLTGSWSTYKQGSYLVKIGKIVFCQFSITGSSTSSTCFTGIPSGWRPTAETRILAGDNVNEAGMFIVNTDGTINPPGNGASTYYTTGSGFWIIS